MHRIVAAVDRVDDGGIVKIIFKGGACQTCADICAIDVVLVLHDVEVHTDLGVGRGGVVADCRRHLAVVSLTETELHDGEVLIFEIHAHAGLVLSVVRDCLLHKSDGVDLDLYATEEGYEVVNLLAPQSFLLFFGQMTGLLRLLLRCHLLLSVDDRGEEYQETNNDTP